MEKTEVFVEGNKITLKGIEKEKPKFLFVFNGMEFNSWTIYSYIERKGEFDKLLEVFPAVYFYEKKKRSDCIWKKWDRRIESTENILTKFIYLIPYIITKYLYDTQCVTITVDVRNKRDRVEIYKGHNSIGNKIFCSFGVKNQHEFLNDRYSSNYELETEHKYVDTNKIVYPNALGGGANRCVIWGIYQILGLMSTYEPQYEIMDIRDMLESSSHNAGLLEVCENYDRCRKLLNKFRNGTYVTDLSESNSGYDDIKLTEYNGYFIPEEGKHRVCMTKRFDIPKVYARVTKCVNIRQKQKSNHYLDYFSHRNNTIEGIMNDCYKRFEDVGLNPEQVKYLLENGLSDAELLKYIEITNNKSLKEIAIEINEK